MAAPHPPAPGPITLMAAGELRDAVDAAQRGDAAAFAAAVASIDPASWAALRQRFAELGTSLPELLHHAAQS